MAENVSREIAGGVIVCDGSILLGWKKADSAGVYKNMWIFPGGVVGPADKNRPEDISEAMRLKVLRSEILEETNLDPVLYAPESIEFNPPLTDSDKVTLKEGKRVGEVITFDMTHFIYLCALKGKPVDYKEIIKPGDELQLLDWFTPSELSHARMPKPSYAVLGRLGII